MNNTIAIQVIFYWCLLCFLALTAFCVVSMRYKLLPPWRALTLFFLGNFVFMILIYLRSPRTLLLFFAVLYSAITTWLVIAWALGIHRQGERLNEKNTPEGEGEPEHEHSGQH